VDWITDLLSSTLANDSGCTLSQHSTACPLSCQDSYLDSLLASSRVNSRVSYIERRFVPDLEWVFLISLLCFLFDSTPQTSLEEGRWREVSQENGIDYQVVKQSPWRGTGFEVAVVERDDSEAIRGVPLIAI